MKTKKPDPARLTNAQHFLRRLAIREQCFFAQDGSVYASLGEFLEGLKRMRPEIFTAHANAQKCDFANWVRDIIGDTTLAASLERVKKSQKMMIQRVASRIKKLDSDLGDAAQAIARGDDDFHFIEND